MKGFYTRIVRNSSKVKRHQRVLHNSKGNIIDYLIKTLRINLPANY